MTKALSALCAGLVMLGCQAASATEISGAVGVTGQGDMTYRVGLGMDWDKNWLQSSVGHLTGQWDLGYTYWEGGDEAGGRHSLSFAPVFIYEFSGDYIKPYIEAGIGVSVFSGTRVGNRDLGSAFNFEDRLGFGLKLGDTQKVGLRVTHYSNAGISQPNDGIESYALVYSHTL